MFPELLPSLSEASDDELAAFIAAAEEFAQTADPAVIAGDLARIPELRDAVNAARTEVDARASRVAEAAHALADLRGPSPVAAVETPEPEPAVPADQEPQPITAAAEPATLPALPTATVEILGNGNHRPEPLRPPTTITAAGGLPDGPVSFNDLEDIGRAVADKWNSFRGVHYGNEEWIRIATVHSNMPEDRTIPEGMSTSRATKLVEQVISPKSIQASGGICAPAQPYYDVMVLAGARRPVRDSWPAFTASRGGITLIPPPQLSSVGAQVRTVTDGVTTNTSNTITSATAKWTSADVGDTISGTGIPANTQIASVAGDGVTATLSKPATATGSSLTFTITQAGSVGFVTAAADAAALGGTAAQIAAALKPCLHLLCGSPSTYTVAAITRCLEIGNFDARTYPEHVTAFMELAMALWARTGETKLLDFMAANSTQVTAAKVLGATRDLIPQILKAAAYMRQHNRMAPDAALRWTGPAWVLDLMQADLVRGSGYETEFLDASRDEVTSALGEANITPTFYEDSGTGKGQYINSGSAQGVGALTTFPTSVVHYLYPEGSFVFLDGGTLDLGVIRDTVTAATNNYRVFAESFETGAFVGLESLEITSTVVADGTSAGAAYGLGASTALPAAF